MTTQPMPVAGHQDVPPVVRERFLATLAAQEAKGQAKYGRGLQTHNGRDAGQDAWEELVDLAQYLTQLRLERDDQQAELVELRAENAALRLALAATERKAPDGTFGAHLFDVRARTGLSAAAVSRRAAVSQSTFSRLESNERHPTRDMLVKLASALRLGDSEVAALFDAAGYESRVAS